MPADEPIPLQMLLWAYSTGIFPMAEHRHGPVQWYSANPRAILPLDAFKASHSLRQRIRRGDYEVRFDTAFEEVIRGCCEPRVGRTVTWINDSIIEVFVKAHEKGFAHSVEAWGFAEERGAASGGERGGASVQLDVSEKLGGREERVLVGGLYGLHLGGAFFGESMFSRATDASKVCLAALVDRLRCRGFVLLDTQMNNDHMAQFGTIEIPREEYEKRLAKAVKMDVSWGE